MPESIVHNADCLAAMREMPDKAYELAIVDPPYGSSIMGKNKHQRHRTTDTTYRNKTAPGADYFRELYRVSERQIIFGCQYMLEHMKPEGSFIVWDKKADPDLHNMSSCDIAWHSKRERVRTFRGHWCGAVKFETEPTIHIHQKPVALYRWLLHNYAKPGDRILDTHLGSGSSRIAAYQMGYDFTGYELDRDHYEAQEKRFTLAIQQQTIF